MIPLYSTDKIRKVDDHAIKSLGIPGTVLMENAAREIHTIAQNHFENKKITKIGFVCGKGNNGGDGFAAARHFANKGYQVFVVFIGLGKEQSPDCNNNLNILKNLSKSQKNIKIENYKTTSSLSSLKNCDVIFDALLGSGISGKLREPYPSILNYLNKLNALKIAIDIPTGLNSDTGFAETAFKADLTITLGNFKKGLFVGDGSFFSGKVFLGRIGIPDSLYQSNPTDSFLIEPEDAFEGLPQKKKNIHKYSAGKVFTIAGSGSLPGAAVLTAKSALKIGAGASVLAFPKSIRDFVYKKMNEFVVHSYSDEDSEHLRTKNLIELKDKIKWADAIAIGPGLGREIQTQKTVIELLKKYKPKFSVIDADAIFALSKGNYKKLNLKNCVLTPHHGEFANLISVDLGELQKDLLKYGRNFTKRTNSYLVLKGAPTIIFTPNGSSLINSSGNPALAKFGSGDVLTGFIAGLIAQTKNIEKSIVTAVYLHGLIADLLVLKNTEYDLLASDLINNVSKGINFLRKSIA